MTLEKTGCKYPLLKGYSSYVKGCQCSRCAAGLKGYLGSLKPGYANEKGREARRRITNWLREYRSKPCMDCGIQYPSVCMDLDHRDPTTKRGNFSEARSLKWAQEEARKCDIVCANCHRLRTHKQRTSGAITPYKAVRQPDEVSFYEKLEREYLFQTHDDVASLIDSEDDYSEDSFP